MPEEPLGIALGVSLGAALDLTMLDNLALG